MFRWPLKPDPIGQMQRNPFQVYLLMVCIFSGLSILIPDVRSSTGSIEQYFLGWEKFVWGGLILLGSTCALAGMYWPWDPRDGLLIKRLGFYVLSVPLLIYGLILFARFGYDSLTLSAALIGFSVASLVQAYRINKVIHQAIERTERNGSA